MLTKQDINYWLRSGSWSFMKNRHVTSQGISAFTYNKRKLFYRSGTFDIAIIYNILLKKGRKAEYYIKDKTLSPSIIFDIGGNIGAAAIYFATLYPNAMIYTFEPVSENFELLSKNVRSYPNIRPFNFALGTEDKMDHIYLSATQENMGGGSFYEEVNIDKTKSIPVVVRSADSIMKELAIDTIDLIKIDTEGAEFDILTTINPLI